MNGEYSERFKQLVHNFLKHPEQNSLLRNNNLDALFSKMYDSNLYGDVGIAYVTKLLYDNGFLVENYVTRTYPYQFRDIKRKTIYLPKCKQIQKYSFAHNKYLEEINAPNVLVACSYAFKTCTNLRKVILPKLKEFSETTFIGCELLKPEDFTVPSDCELKPIV